MKFNRLFLFLASAVLGTLMPLGFAPFNYWGILPFTLALWIMLIYQSRHGFIAGFGLGLGCFGFGLWWVSISIHQFGGGSLLFAMLGVAALAAILSIYYGFVGFILSKLAFDSSIKIGVVLPILWTLIELLRAHLLTGFPWLALGYSLVDSPFSVMIIPKMGALMGSIWVIWAAALLSLVLINYQTTRQLKGVAKNIKSIKNQIHAQNTGYLSYLPNILLGMLLCLSLLVSNYFGTPIVIDKAAHKVSAVQGNIPQETKFTSEQQAKSLTRYLSLSKEAFESSDLIVWPETAIVEFYEDMPEFYSYLQEFTKNNDNTIILGTLRGNYRQQEYRNTIVAVTGSQLNQPFQFYDKYHLLPFGEYMPFGSLLRFFEQWVQIPMSNMTAGAAKQSPIVTKHFNLGASICFESVFGSETRYHANQSDILVNLSNDAWFGNSLAPWQHFQIARARSIEMARPMVRATNTGVSAIVDHQGYVVKMLPIYTEGVITGEMYKTSGITPYVYLGDWPWFLFFSGLLVILPFSCRRK